MPASHGTGSGLPSGQYVPAGQGPPSPTKGHTSIPVPLLTGVAVEAPLWQNQPAAQS